MTPAETRERLGRIVREVWVETMQLRNSLPWEGLAECDREFFRRVGEQLAEKFAAHAAAAVDLVRRLADIGHDGYRDAGGECPFCAAHDHEPAHGDGCLIGAAMALHPKEPAAKGGS